MTSIFCSEFYVPAVTIDFKLADIKLESSKAKPVYMALGSIFLPLSYYVTGTFSDISRDSKDDCQS